MLVVHPLAQAKVVMVLTQCLDILQQLLLLAVVVVAVSQVIMLMAVTEDLVVVMVLCPHQLDQEMQEEMIRDVVLFQRDLMVEILVITLMVVVVEVLHKQDKEMETMLGPVE